MEVLTVPVAELKPAEYNPRRISEEDFEQIKKSIEEFGFVQPLVANRAPGREGVIIGGHQRFQVAKKMGMDSVPVFYVTIADLDREKELNIRLNKNQGEFDWDLLQRHFTIDGLTNWGFDMKQINLNFEFPTTGPSADTIPETPEKVRACKGEVYTLGRHRVACGDSTVATDVDKALQGRKPVLMVTDPPYGVNYDPKWRAEAGVNHNQKKMGKVENDDRADWREAWVLFPGDVAYVWHADKFASKVQASLEASDFTIRSQIIWAKDRFALSRGDYHWQHEPCWYAVKNGRTSNWTSDRKQSTVWEIPARENSGVGHGTQKPVECMAKPIRNNSAPGQEVYDPFLGSGTTLIACEMLERTCYGLELNPAYVDVIIKRYCNFTGANEDEIYARAKGEAS